MPCWLRRWTDRCIEPVGDVSNVRILALEGERRGPCCHLQVADACQRIEQLLGQPVREILRFRIAAHIGERQHGNGVGGWGERCRCRRRRRPALPQQNGRYHSHRCHSAHGDPRAAAQCVLAGAVGQAIRPYLHRFAAQVPLQLIRQGRCRCISLLGRTRQRLQHDRIEIPTQPPGKLLRRRGPRRRRIGQDLHIGFVPPCAVDKRYASVAIVAATVSTGAHAEYRCATPAQLTNAETRACELARHTLCVDAFLPQDEQD
jgi:hypothetical protein